MRNIYNKNKKVIKTTAAVVCSAGLGWVIYQIHKTRKLINNALNTSVIDLLEPKSNLDFSQSDPLFTKLFEKYRNTVFSSPSSKWTYLKFVYAQRLLAVANTDIKSVRKTAIKQLSRISGLEQWQFQMLSQICNAKTAVSLARIFGSDLSFIQEPPFRNQKLIPQDVVNSVKDLLYKLTSASEHICISYFLETAFPEDHEHPKFADHEFPNVGLTKMIESSNNILPLCIESLLHHSSVESQAKDIAMNKGLPLLMEVYKLYPEDVDVNISICKILSHISTFPQFLKEMHSTGWIRVLAEWARDSDLRLSLPAAKTLANLDTEKDIAGLYSRSLYVLHPTCNMFESPYVDVIFIHGLLGGVFFTWRQRREEKETVGLIGKQRDKGQPKSRKYSRPDKILSDPVESISNDGIYFNCPPKKDKIDTELEKNVPTIYREEDTDFEFVLNDLPTKSNEDGQGPFSFTGIKLKEPPEKDDFSQCWPKDWLPEDCKHLRIIGINYDTNLSMWAPLCPMERSKSTIEERSNELITKLLRAGVGDRPIVWVTHSMGGLIAKNILCKAWKSDDPKMKNIAEKTKSIIFYSTPHTGSKIASATMQTSYVLWPSVEVQELRQEFSGLKDIHNNFLEFLRHQPLEIVSFVETKPILVTAMKFNVLLVDPESGNPGVGEYFEIPLDHLGICKPKNKYSFLYQKTLNVIMKAVREEIREREKENIRHQDT